MGTAANAHLPPTQACLSSAWLLPDLTPNVGLHWYFFTEVFARFKPYYLLVFAAHPFLYALPLAVRLRCAPRRLGAWHRLMR